MRKAEHCVVSPVGQLSDRVPFTAHSQAAHLAEYQRNTTWLFKATIFVHLLHNIVLLNLQTLME